MGIIEWATSPLGQNVPIHIAWFLIWVALIAGMLFLIVHAIYVRYFAKEKEFAGRRFARKLRPSCPRAFPGTRWRRGCFTGSWRRPCSFCCLPRSCPRWASASTG